MKIVSRIHETIARIMTLSESESKKVGRIELQLHIETNNKTDQGEQLFGSTRFIGSIVVVIAIILVPLMTIVALPQ